MTDSRPNPDELLSALQREELAARRGRLKVFLGMCPGVGKTYAMLEATQREARAGVDLVIGYVESHGRVETDALAAGLPRMERRLLEHRGVKFEEFDLDATLARCPRLAVVDELAHANAPGSRHPKRWQDVLELLDAGIDVFTTLNVQHVESRAEVVQQIAGIEVRETVPDRVLDGAILELVDLPPAELLGRLRAGKVYLGDRAAAAAQGFFREGTLTALRELALRLVADHVGEDTRELRRAQPDTSPWKVVPRLLVAVGPSPLSGSLIRWTRRTADSLQCRWLAVHVAGARPLAPTAQARLNQHLALARELGAEVISTTDEDLARGLLRVAREQNATQIVLGKPGGNTNWLQSLRGGRLLRQLLRDSGSIDLLVVRAEGTAGGGSGELWEAGWHSPPRQYAIALGALAVTALVNVGLSAVAGPRVPGIVFLLAVVLLALRLGRGPVLFAGSLSALAWNFFFLPPRFTLVIAQLEDAVLFGTYFVVAIVLGQLVSRIRLQERAERVRESRATALYDLMRDLAEASSRDEVVWQLVRQVHRVFQAPATVCLPAPQGGLVAHPDGNLPVSEKELGVADWAFRRQQAAGKFTDNLPGAEALHLPLATERRTFGILSVALPEKVPGPGQRELLETFARQAALVLDRVDLRAAAEKTRLLAESERLGRALLNSISHELRTPLAASTSAASALAEAETAPIDQRRALVGEIQVANARLNRIVGNLLDVARIESGSVAPRLDWHDACDLVQTTVRELHAELAGHPLTLDLPPGPLLARFDFTLLHHALANLLLNAATHTPAGTPIEVSARRTPESVIWTVADRGPGIPPEVLPRLFDKFFRAPQAPAGGSGLGLTIARGFAECHGGSVRAENRPDGGARFLLELPQTVAPPAVDIAP